MRILHALPALNRGGTERLVLALASHQQEQGHAVVVVTFDPLNLWPQESARLRVESFPCTTAIHRFLRRPVHDAQTFETFLKTWNPDVVHSHSHWTERIVLACLDYRGVLIQHFHLEYSEWKRPRWHHIRQWCGRWQLCLSHIRRGTRFVAVSHATTAYYRQHFPVSLSGRLHWLPNFLALPIRSEPRSAVCKPLRLLSVGRFVTVKRHDRLLPLAAELVRRGVSFEMHLLGDGPLRLDIERSIRDLELSDYVKCCGNHPDMLAFYDNADLLLHPASSEPFGLVILEAMARGLPCIVEQSSSGPRDFLHSGINGYNADFSDVSGTADRLIELCRSLDLYRRISACALTTAQAYALSSYWHALASIYDLKPPLAFSMV
jgi:glycosyltransferase involved in cell wall biosynthesis